MSGSISPGLSKDLVLANLECRNADTDESIHLGVSGTQRINCSSVFFSINTKNDMKNKDLV